MSYLLGDMPSKSEIEMVALLRLIDSVEFRTLAYQLAKQPHATPTYAYLEQLHAAVVGAVKLNDMFGQWHYADRPATLRLGASKNGGELTVRRFIGHGVATQARDLAADYDCHVGIEFKLSMSNAARGEDLIPGIYRLYLGLQDVRVEAVTFRPMPGLNLNAVVAVAETTDWHIPSRVMHKTEWAFTPLGTADVSYGLPAFPTHYLSWREQLPTQESDKGVVVALRRPAPVNRILLSTRMSFVRSVDEVGFYKGDAFEAQLGESEPRKVSGFLALEAVRKFVKQEFNASQNILMCSPREAMALIDQHRSRRLKDSEYLTSLQQLMLFEKMMGLPEADQAVSG
jgi:hypothetical protein